MVGQVPADHLDAVGLSPQLEVLAGQLPRRLDGVGAASGEKHPVQVTGGQFGQFRGEFDRRGVAVGPYREKPEGCRLVAGRPGQLGPPVTELAHKEPGQSVQITVALGIPHVAAVAPLDHPSAVDVVAEHAEVAPQVSFG